MPTWQDFKKSVKSAFLIFFFVTWHVLSNDRLLKHIYNIVTWHVLSNDRLLKHIYNINLLFFLAFVNNFWKFFAHPSDIVAF